MSYTRYINDSLLNNIYQDLKSGLKTKVIMKKRNVSNAMILRVRAAICNNWLYEENGIIKKMIDF